MQPVFWLLIKHLSDVILSCAMASTKNYREERCQWTPQEDTPSVDE